jgi:hypothetical protein
MKLATRGGKEDHVRGALVVAPPREVQVQCDQISIEEAVVKAAEVHFQRVLTPEEVTVVSQFVTVVHTANLQVDSVLECLNNAGEEWAVVVLQAGLYRAERAADTESSDGVSLPEDLWVPHLVELAHRAIPIAKEKKFYLLLDTGESAPLKPGNIERVQGIQDCGVFGFRLKHDADQLVAERSAGWKVLAKSGRLGPAFAAIDELPEWMDSHKAFLKLQVMHGIAPPDEILRVLRDDIPSLLANADSRAKLKLAQIAEHADDDDLARSLLRSSVDGLRSAEDLLLAADVADIIAVKAWVKRSWEWHASCRCRTPSRSNRFTKSYPCSFVSTVICVSSPMRDSWPTGCWRFAQSSILPAYIANESELCCSRSECWRFSIIRKQRGRNFQSFVSKPQI